MTGSPPLSADKAYYDYQIISEDRSRLKILLAAVKAEILDPYLQAFSQRRIRVQRVISSLSAFGALSHAVAGETAIFVDDRPGMYEGVLIDRGRLADYFTGKSSAAGGAYFLSLHLCRSRRGEWRPLNARLRTAAPA